MTLNLAGVFLVVLLSIPEGRSVLLTEYTGARAWQTCLAERDMIRAEGGECHCIRGFHLAMKDVK